MEDSTALVLSLQLVALCCIAAALLLYLVCRLRGRGFEGQGSLGAMPGAVLVTACDTAMGLHVALHLARQGCRVFAGLREPHGTGPAARALRAFQKGREVEATATDGGSLVTLALDVTREDSLHEAVGAVRKHLPAGEDGLWAVVSTTGLCCRGRLDHQDSSQWDTMLKHNVVALLRTARTFTPLLKSKQGRLITVGASTQDQDQAVGGAGLVAYTGARYAAEGVTTALREEVAHLGVSVISLRPHGPSETLFMAPTARARPRQAEGQQTVVDMPECPGEADFSVLPPRAMHTVEEALTCPAPRHSYRLTACAPSSSLRQMLLRRLQRAV